jgi:hypothetical protein
MIEKRKGANKEFLVNYCIYIEYVYINMCLSICMSYMFVYTYVSMFVCIHAYVCREEFDVYVYICIHIYTLL